MGLNEGAIAGYLNGGTPRCFYRDKGQSLPLIERPNGAGRGKAEQRTLGRQELEGVSLLRKWTEARRHCAKSGIFAYKSSIVALMYFDELDLEDEVLDGLEAMNFFETTPDKKPPCPSSSTAAT